MEIIEGGQQDVKGTKAAKKKKPSGKKPAVKKSNKKEKAPADRIARMKNRIVRLEALVKKYEGKGKAAKERLAMVRGKLASLGKAAPAKPKKEEAKAA